MNGTVAATRSTTLAHDTYIVLEVAPAPWLDTVYALRRRYDPARVSYPVEVTVVGSSGLGCLVATNDLRRTLDVVSGVAASTHPLDARFAAVRRFPGTAIFWLAPEPGPFVAMHAAFAQSDLEFIPIAFPYTPHCTLVDLGSRPSDEALQDVLAFPIPDASTRFSEVALYVVGDDGLPLRTHTFALGNATPQGAPLDRA